MISPRYRRRLLGVSGFGVVIAMLTISAIAGSKPELPAKSTSVPLVPTEHFRPSNSKTVDGRLIPSDQFFPSSRCAGCHSDTHKSWSESLHRNAAREPFYRESADLLMNSRGIEYTRHCESCHTPVALFAGALTTGSTEPRDMGSLHKKGIMPCTA